MKKIIILLLFCCTNLFAQNPSPDNRIVVLGEAELQLPANRVKFNVTLIATSSENIENAYSRHSEMEKQLLNLFKEFAVKKETIHYSLLTVNKTKDYQDKEWVYSCSKSIDFVIDSIKLTYKVQERLIKNDFNNFNIEFISTDLEKSKADLLKKAVSVAEEKAKTLAEAGKRKIKRVSKIMDTEETDPSLTNFHPFERVGNMMMAMDPRAGGTLMDIPQTITISKTVKVVFEVEE